jgi:hypothetical protein
MILGLVLQAQMTGRLTVSIDRCGWYWPEANRIHSLSHLTLFQNRQADLDAPTELRRSTPILHRETRCKSQAPSMAGA